MNRNIFYIGPHDRLFYSVQFPRGNAGKRGTQEHKARGAFVSHSPRNKTFYALPFTALFVREGRAQHDFNAISFHPFRLSRATSRFHGGNFNVARKQSPELRAKPFRGNRIIHEIRANWCNNVKCKNFAPSRVKVLLLLKFERNFQSAASKTSCSLELLGVQNGGGRVISPLVIIFKNMFVNEQFVWKCTSPARLTSVHEVLFWMGGYSSLRDLRTARCELFCYQLDLNPTPNLEILDVKSAWFSCCVPPTSIFISRNIVQFSHR